MIYPTSFSPISWSPKKTIPKPKKNIPTLIKARIVQGEDGFSFKHVHVPEKSRKMLTLQRNILLVQNEDGFILKAVPNILDLAGTLKSDKKLSDTKIKSLRKKAFLKK